MNIKHNLAATRTHIPLLHVVKPKKQRKKIKARSSKMTKLMAEYRKLKAAFIHNHPRCQWWLSDNGLYPDSIYRADGSSLDSFVNNCPWATDIHHKRGRGKYLLDTTTWMAVSREGHDWIHAHPKESYEKGYMLKR